MADPEVEVDIKDIKDAQEESEQSAAWIIDLILDKGAATLYLSYVDSLQFQFCAQAITDSILQLIEINSSKHSREIMSEHSIDNPEHIQEQLTETPPTVCDAWGSCIIPIRQKKTIDHFEQYERSMTTGSTNGTFKRRSSQRSIESQKYRAKKSEIIKSMDSTHKKSLKGVSKTIQIVQECCPSDHLRNRFLECEKRKKIVSEKLVHISTKLDEEKKQVKEFKRKLDGRDYALDNDGKLIVMENPECCFPATVSVKVDIKTDNEQSPSPFGVIRSASTMKKKGARAKSRREMTSQPNNDSFFFKSNAESSRNFVFEEIVPSAGVNIKSGNELKTGSLIPIYPSKMSKKLFQKKHIASSSIDDTISIDLTGDHFQNAANILGPIASDKGCNEKAFSSLEKPPVTTPAKCNLSVRSPSKPSSKSSVSLCHRHRSPRHQKVTKSMINSSKC